MKKGGEDKSGWKFKVLNKMKTLEESIHNFIHKFIKDTHLFKDETFSLISKFDSDDRLEFWVHFSKKEDTFSIKVYQDKIVKSFQESTLENLSDDLLFCEINRGVENLYHFTKPTHIKSLEEGVYKFCGLISSVKGAGCSLENYVYYKSVEFILNYTEIKDLFVVIISLRGKPFATFACNLVDYSVKDIFLFLSKEIEKAYKKLTKDKV